MSPTRRRAYKRRVMRWKDGRRPEVVTFGDAWMQMQRRLRGAGLKIVFTAAPLPLRQP